ncbi:hypothetical protein TNCV_1656131 [Trichonephila clavipes]|nr:hypothetical protein TNCV_1656131 [Trichonephila clavipes]
MTCLPWLDTLTTGLPQPILTSESETDMEDQCIEAAANGSLRKNRRKSQTWKDTSAKYFRDMSGQTGHAE